MSETAPSTNDEVVAQARELGALLARHPAAKAYHDATTALQEDTEAQRLLADLDRLSQQIREKETGGQPVEVEEKHQLRDLQSQVGQHALIGRWQMAQMDYVDLMRRVDAAIADPDAT